MPPHISLFACEPDDLPGIVARMESFVRQSEIRAFTYRLDQLLLGAPARTALLIPTDIEPFLQVQAAIVGYFGASGNECTFLPHCTLARSPLSSFERESITNFAARMAQRRLRASALHCYRKTDCWSLAWEASLAPGAVDSS